MRSWVDRRRFAALIAWLAAVLAFPPASRAVVVLPKKSNQPVMGYLVRQDERTVVIRQPLEGGQSREIPFSRSDIDELIITVSPERLAALDPARPETYREYAEELAEKQRDPEARDMARRLYAIAAERGEGNLRTGALLGLVALAQTPEEERKFRAAAFLFAEEHDDGVLIDPRAAPPADASALGRADLLAALRLIRQGQGAKAVVLLERPGVQTELAAVADIITPAQLKVLAAARTLTERQLLLLLRAELILDGAGAAAAGRSTGAPRVESAGPPWSSATAGGGTAPLPPLRLDEITEFDPADCLYREGKWIKP
jgi:hypothetical protein